MLTLERLPGCALPLPVYATEHSAGLDFAACLTRPCKVVYPGSSNKIDFWVNLSDREPDRLTSDPLFHKSGDFDLTKLTLHVNPTETVLIPLGFRSAFPPAYVLKIYVRSSVGLRGLILANGTAIIDSDYRGDLFAAIHNRSGYIIDINHGERIVQGILTSFVQAQPILEGPVDTTVRGEGGLGSTGK